MLPRLEFIPETASTNADLLARLSSGEGLSEGHWLIANRQTQGRGRQGRQWIDAPGNFMGSTLVRLAAQDPPAASLSFLSALAVYNTVAGMIAQPSALQLKWPNDILLSGAKFCGILLERAAEFAVVGIGVNLASAPAIGGRDTLSLADMGARIDRDLFARNLAGEFAEELVRWRTFGTESMLARWQAAAHPHGTRLSVHGDRGEVIAGRFEGLDADGAMRLRLDDGSTRVIHAGDVMLEGSGRDAARN